MTGSSSSAGTSPRGWRRKWQRTPAERRRTAAAALGDLYERRTVRWPLFALAAVSLALHGATIPLMVAWRGASADTLDITIDGGHMVPIQYSNLDLTSAYRYNNLNNYNPEAFIYYYDNNWTVHNREWNPVTHDGWVELGPNTFDIHTEGDLDTYRTQNGIGANDLHGQVTLSNFSNALLVHVVPCQQPTNQHGKG